MCILHVHHIHDSNVVDKALSDCQASAAIQFCHENHEGSPQSLTLLRNTMLSTLHCTGCACLPGLRRSAWPHYGLPGF